MSATEDDQPVSSGRRLGLGAAAVVVLAALAVTVAIGIFRSAAAPVETVTGAVGTTVSPAPNPDLFVHVSGAVRIPGLYGVPDGSRVVDGVAAAGGFADDADRSAVNLARALVDGEQLHVPREGETPEPPSSGAGGVPVNLNTADLAALDTLPRIGPALAQRIIDWRATNGPLASVEDLLAIPGIGEKMLDSLRDLVTV